MTRTIHMCVSVRGLLSKTRSELKRATGYMLMADGSRHTVESLREALFDELAEGHEVIPMGDCDDFDWKTGCRGHVVAEAKP